MESINSQNWFVKTQSIKSWAEDGARTDGAAHKTYYLMKILKEVDPELWRMVRDDTEDVGTAP